MISFELFDNLFQVAVLGGFSVAAFWAAFRNRSRRCLILSLAYACFAMGTLYYVLTLAILGHTPKIFYVAEVSWLASWLFYLSFQITRTEALMLHLSWKALGGGMLITACVLVFRIFGPSYLMSSMFALTVGALVFLSLFRVQNMTTGRKTDAVLLTSAVLQVLLYVISGFTENYSRFNLYFAVDIVLTVSFAALLPLHLREVTKK